MIITLTVFIIYFALLLYIGYLAYKRNSDFSDYILGGRTLGPIVGGVSTGASDMSGWLLMAFPGAVYATGISGGVWIAVGLAIGAYINWRYVGNRVRQFTIVSGDSHTLPHFLSNRTRDTSQLIKIISAIFIVIFFSFYVSSGLVAGGLLFVQTLDVSYSLGMLIIATVILIYTLTGGFYAITWTDFVQGIIMLFALLFVSIVAFGDLGGWTETISSIGSIDSEKLDAFSGITTLGIVGALAWGLLGYYGQPHAILRFMAMKSSSDITVGRAVYTTWNVLAMYGGIFVGLTGIAFFANDSLDNPETVFISMTQLMFHPLIAAILLVALLAAVMSTVSTQLLVSATALAEDIYRGVFRKHASEKELLTVIKLSIILVTIFAVIIAFDPDSVVMDLVSYAWAGFAAAFGPAVLFSLFWRGTTRNGILASIIIGGTTVIVWDLLTQSGFIPFVLYELVPGFFFSSVTLVIFSKIGPKPTHDMQAEFDEVQKTTHFKY